MILKLQFFWELTEGGSPPSFSRAFSSTWQGLSALPHTRIGQILASLANSCLGASICPMRVWLASCRFALALSQTFNVCWEYGQICACVSPYFPTFPDISRHFLPPKRKFFRTALYRHKHTIKFWFFSWAWTKPIHFYYFLSTFPDINKCCLVITERVRENTISVYRPWRIWNARYLDI